jgi:nitrate/nitrite transporter NarK
VLFNNIVVIYAAVGLFGILGGLQVSSLFTIPMELPNMSVRSGVVVISVMQVGGNLGNFVSPLTVGYLADLTGSYLPGFIIFSVFSLSLLAAGLLLPETGPKARPYPVIGQPQVAEAKQAS